MFTIIIMSHSYVNDIKRKLIECLTFDYDVVTSNTFMFKFLRMDFLLVLFFLLIRNLP